MIKKIISTAILLFIPCTAFSTCFIAREDGKVIYQEGVCKKRYTPMSTFKIPLLVIGLDSGILSSADNPEWQYDEKYIAIWNHKRKICEGIQTPQSWITNSCVWYSQQITLKLGEESFKKYVTKLNYGNQDVSGNKGKKNGLTHSWLVSSLKISPIEQTVFLEDLVNDKLNVSTEAQVIAKSILSLDEIDDGWQLYGKTGSSNKEGWFVGWVEKDGRKIVFAQYVNDRFDKNAAQSTGIVAKQRATETLKLLTRD